MALAGAKLHGRRFDADQFAVASGLTQAGVQSGGRGQVLRALNQLTSPQARAAFASLSGKSIAAAQNVANRSLQLFTSSIFDQTTFYAGGGAANSVTLTEPLPGFSALAPSERAPIRELADLPAARVAPVAVPVATRTCPARPFGRRRRPARDAAQVKAGAEMALSPHSALFANFDGKFSGVNQLYDGKGGFRYVW